MKLGYVMNGVEVLQFHPDWEQKWQEKSVGGICTDSRKIKPGDLFVALAGEHVDGHRYVSRAQAQGAIGAVVENIQPEIEEEKFLQLKVPSTKKAIAQLASAWYGHPAQGLILCAITGTNGKTTTSFLLEALLANTSHRVGLLGTVVYRYPGHSESATLTTPDALTFHRLLATMRTQQVQTVVLEASSHALALNRLEGLPIRIAGFTNLTQDHLDFHGDMESYFQAKTRLFTELLLPANQGGRAVIFVDDPYGERLAQTLPPEQVIRVSVRGQGKLSSKTDIWVDSSTLSVNGIQALFHTPIGTLTIQSPLCGIYNLSNLSIALGMGIALGLSADLLSKGLSLPLQVPGRLERVSTSDQGPQVFVDYAHTPDALQRVLQTLREALPAPSSRLVVVFGCGGDRDPGKRMLMGHIASDQADVVVLTSDNPRSERPEHILAAIQRGVSLPLATKEELKTLSKVHWVHADRRIAIRTAIQAAGPKDIVLLAGKGHENYQWIGNEKLSFDDREEARRALQELYSPL